MKGLSDLLVVDLTHVLAGPFCTMLLADLGATVVKVEPPGEGDHTRGVGPIFAGDQSAYFLAVNRNKKGIVLDLKQPGGLALLGSLGARADVIIDNFRPGTLSRMGIDYDAMREVNPRLVSCSVSATGSTGIYADLAGYDLMIQAMGGLMSVTGPPAGPPTRMGVPVADLLGGIYATVGILAALRERDQTGRGRHVELSLLDAQVSLLSYVATQSAISGKDPVRMGNAHSFAVPYESFPTADGDLVVAVPSDRFWPPLCKALQRTDLLENASYATEQGRHEGRSELIPELQRIFLQRGAAEWEDELRKAGVPCSRVRGVLDVLRDPELVRRGMVREYDHATAGRIQVVNNPLRFEGDDGRQFSPAPQFGEHTREVLSSLLGLPDAEVAELERARTITTLKQGAEECCLTAK